MIAIDLSSQAACTPPRTGVFPMRERDTGRCRAGAAEAILHIVDPRLRI